MADRVTLTRDRYTALVLAASKWGCTCAAPEYRAHEGKCISCWALVERIAKLRELCAKTDSVHLPRILAECEEEQEFRAKQLPAAERRLAEARENDRVQRA